MAKKILNKIFLSASIPYADRHPEFYDTADVLAIRDSVRALAAVVIPKAHLVWGGHPAITPLIRYVVERMTGEWKSHITLYQSRHFEKDFPKDNFAFENIQLIPDYGDISSSVFQMRKKMFEENIFSAAVFIGGMEGVIDEYRMFREYYPQALTIPLASTGAAAKIVYDEFQNSKNKRLTNDYAYMALFRDLLADFIK
ncbi:MAG: hypothetical protein J0H85_04090 [Sediminibacterium magnilacihabitans]|jgi:hypothetical protein|nr:hypothetical protein [Sediminibacterium magnilacihabitans]PQV61925.1 hypothetical protein CLV53_101199 [Sediminibacterium magnilacihabitans]